jgi:hypothetical protein
MRHLADLAAVQAHIRAAVKGKNDYVFLATGPGRVVLFALVARLFAEGVWPDLIVGGSFQVGLLPDGKPTSVAFLTVPSGMINRTVLSSILSRAAELKGQMMTPDNHEQDIFVFSDQIELLQAALLHIVSA